MQAVGSSTISLATLQQMFGTLQNDLSSLTGQFGAEAIGSSANTTGSSDSIFGTSSSGSSTSGSSPAPSTPSTQFASDTLSALIGTQTQSGGWASNEASNILSADGSNGEISLAQVTSAMQSMGSTDSTSQITSAFNQMDTNGDGELSQSELTSALQQMQQSQGGGGGHHHHHRVSGSSGASSSSTSSSTTTTDALGVVETSSPTATTTSSIFSTTTSTS